MTKQYPLTAAADMPATATRPDADWPDTASMIETDSSRTIRNGGLVMLLGLGVFVAWAATAPLDEGVPADGQVSLEMKSSVIQHQTGGVVEKLQVKEGQFVQQGQVLMTLDVATTKARYEEVRQHYLGLRSYENRLLSEQSGQATIQFHQDLLGAGQDTGIQSKMADQQHLLRARRHLLGADIAQMDEAIRAEQVAMQGSQQLVQHKRAELQLVQQQMQDMREAVDEGYVPKVQYAELQQRAAQLNGDIAQASAAVGRSSQLILEYQSKITARRQSEHKDVDEQLAKVRLEVDAEAEKFNALKSELQRTEIKAPVDGQVIGLQVHSAGAVIQPGQRLLHIVPVSGHLLLDAKIPPHLIDRIAVGQSADVRFSAFAHTPQLLVEGKVVSVSTDVIADPAARLDSLRYYYLARIEVTPGGMQALGARVMKPGMPTQVVIKTGERTFLTYWLHPLTQRFSASLKEE